MHITKIQAGCTLPQGYELFSQNTGNEYIFLHFLSHAMLHSTYVDLLVDPGACIIFKKHTRMHLTAPDGPLKLDYFILRGDADDAMYDYKLRFNRVYYPIDSPAVSQAVRNMEKEFARPGMYAEKIYETQVNAILQILTRNTPQPCALSANVPMHEKLELARKTMLSRFTEDWTAEQIAALAGMHRTAFYEAYTHIYGITPKQELILCRIRHAEMLLLQNKLSTRQIAAMCGYKSESHFIRQFKAHTGATPNKYHCL